MVAKFLRQARIALALIVLTFMQGAVPTALVYAKGIPDSKITICHRTDSNSNPYRLITVDKNAAGKGKDAGDHADRHQGPVWDPSLKEQHTKWGDIIPPFENLPTGYNWTTEGQAIYNNGCKVPVTPPEVNYVTPVSPTISDICGTDNDSYTLATTEHVTYTDTKVGDLLTVTAVADQGYTLQLGGNSGWVLNQDGSATFTYAFINTPCKEVSPVKPGEKDRCGTVNDTYTIPEIEGVSYYLTSDLATPLTSGDHFTNGDLKVKIVAKANDGYVFTNGKTQQKFKLKFTNKACQPNPVVVTPQPPHRKDRCGTDRDFYIIKNTKKVAYYLSSDLQTALANGRHSTNGALSVSISVFAKQGYVFANGQTFQQFTLTFTDESCQQPPLDVCPNLIGIQSNVPQDRIIDENGNCVSPPVVCPELAAGNLILSQNSDNDTCQPGKGGGTETPPVVPPATKPPVKQPVIKHSAKKTVEMPTELPATGSTASPLLALLAGVLAYGAVYLLQGRRRYDQVK